MISAVVHGAPTSSTSGMRCGGLTGWATRQRWRPLRLCVNKLATMVEVEEARMASGAASRSSSEKIEGARLRGDIEPDVIERDIEAAACKNNRPGATDQTGSDDGDAIFYIHSIFLLSARSSLNACEGPVQVTVP